MGSGLKGCWEPGLKEVTVATRSLENGKRGTEECIGVSIHQRCGVKYAEASGRNVASKQGQLEMSRSQKLSMAFWRDRK